MGYLLRVVRHMADESEISFDAELEAKELLEQTKHTKPITDCSSGDVLFEAYDSLERFAAERLILVARKLELDEDLILQMLKTNAEFANNTKRRIRDTRPRREQKQLHDSLAASGLV